MLLIKAGLERFFFENNNRYLFSSQSSGRISIILVGKKKPREIESSDSVMLIKETSYLSLSNSKNRKYLIGFYSLKILKWLKMWMKKKYTEYLLLHVHPNENFMIYSILILPSIILLKILVKYIGGYSAFNNGVTCISI